MASCSCQPLHGNTSFPPTFCRVCPLSGKDHMSSLTLSSHSSFLLFLISYCLINPDRTFYAGAFLFPMHCTKKPALRTSSLKGEYISRYHLVLYLILSYNGNAPAWPILIMIFQPCSSEATFTSLCQERSHSPRTILSV